MTAPEPASSAGIRPAATVVLLRDGDSGPEVYLLHRVPQMVFAPGMTVFPGGGVDPVDDVTLPGAADWLRRWAGSWGLDDDLGRRLAAAAVRELHEETGVELPVEALRPWARWVTPAGQSRRYDTFFVTAAVPEGATPRLLTTEAHDAGWWRPDAALDAARAGEVAMLPPTVAVLADLAGFGSVAEIVSATRDLTAVEPVVVSAPGEPLVVDAAGRHVPALGLPPAPGR